MADFNYFGVNFYAFSCAESVRRAIKKSKTLKIQDGGHFSRWPPKSPAETGSVHRDGSAWPILMILVSISMFFLYAESVRRAIKKSNILKIQDGHQNHLLKPEVLIGMVVFGRF